ncbi:hypothetical protein [Streptomyces sp. NPDC056105]|uniref:hypothetical protein n=1 Tax=Streptomyces sp. NPDC056105 TaxID=3345714 RepID=UPI0035DEB3C8
MGDFDLRAVALGQRLFRLLQALDSDPTARPLLAMPISTAAGFSWGNELSEVAVERLTRILEAAEARPQSVARPVLRLVPTLEEAS